jgi:hypothetical protein
MGWFRRREVPAEEVRGEGVTRLTSSGRRDVEVEETTLDDQETVLSWVRGLRQDRDQVFIDRSWGTVVALAADGRPPGVILSDEEHTWHAVPPGGGEKADLSPEQLEQLMLDVMSSPERPTWPDWHQLT